MPEDSGEIDSGTEGSEGAEGKTFTQEQLNKLLATQKSQIEKQFAGFEEIKSKAAQLDALTETSKTEVQRATELAQKAERERDEAQQELAARDIAIRQRDIAAKNNLDPNLWEFVGGTTPEDIEASVKKLLAHSAPRRPQGLRSGASNENVQSKQERAVEALRAMNRG